MIDQTTVTAICGAVIAASTLGNNIMNYVIARRQSRNARKQVEMHAQNCEDIADLKQQMVALHK